METIVAYLVALYLILSFFWPVWLLILAVLFFDTKRSEAAQRCPPSAMGSASAAPTEPQAVKSQPVPMASLPSNGKAEDEASDDSSVVQLLKRFGGDTCFPVAIRLMRTRHKLEKYLRAHELCWTDDIEKLFEELRQCELQIYKQADDAPQRSGGERRKLNA